MKNRRRLALVLILSFLSVPGLLGGQDHGQEKSQVKRFFVAIGANAGGKDRVQLRYATSDAESILKVFKELGGVSPDDSLLILDPNIKTIYTEIGRLQAQIEQSRAKFGRVEVFCYYSGHSDDEHLLIGDEKISYQDWRDTVMGLDADVRITILDSCASGAFTRIKGGKKKRPFLMDSAFNMKGFAVMTSSSATEASQESDILQGSFFTHYLVSAMRGAGDMNQDGRVTLNEAYQFAFNETLIETTKTRSGPQHPNYDIKMSGTGDVIMTDIRTSSAVLVLGVDMTGKVFIHDSNNQLVLELTKPPGRRVELGLEEGEYRVINIAEGKVFESSVELRAGQEVELSGDSFAETEKQYTTPRGDRAEKIQKEALLRGKSSLHPYIGFDTKASGSHVIMGFNLGLTFNRVFSVGIASYAKTNFVDGFPGMPGYGGITFAYAFSPLKKWSLRLTALAGTGAGGNFWVFYVFEPGIEGVLNLSRYVRIKAGLSFPITDSENEGLKSPIFSVGFQFGK